MTDLRREAEALANKIIETITVHPTGDYDADEHDWNVHALSRAEFVFAMSILIEAFAKAQRREEVEAFEQRIEEHHAKDHWYFKSIKLWLMQRKKELE